MSNMVEDETISTGRDYDVSVKENYVTDKDFSANANKLKVLRNLSKTRVKHKKNLRRLQH